MYVCAGGRAGGCQAVVMKVEPSKSPSRRRDNLYCLRRKVTKFGLFKMSHRSHRWERCHRDNCTVSAERNL
ncbi:hypothetical protein ACHAXM_000528, partial [Skeletonema potamos]